MERCTCKGKIGVFASGSTPAHWQGGALRAMRRQNQRHAESVTTVTCTSTRVKNVNRGTTPSTERTSTDQTLTAVIQARQHTWALAGRRATRSAAAKSSRAEKCGQSRVRAAVVATRAPLMKRAQRIRADRAWARLARSAVGTCVVVFF